MLNYHLQVFNSAPSNLLSSSLTLLQCIGSEKAWADSGASANQELLDCAKLPMLYNRRLQDIATLMFKIKHSLVPVNISDLFNLKNTQYNLQNSDFELPRFETVRFGRNSIKYMGPLIWSKLPRYLGMVKTLNLFKRNIRKVDLYTLVNI